MRCNNSDDSGKCGGWAGTIEQWQFPSLTILDLAATIDGGNMQNYTPSRGYANIPWYQLVFGEDLTDKKGIRVDSGQLAGKFVCVVFSSSWCPASRGFEAFLTSFYNKPETKSFGLEVVYASYDYSKTEMLAHIATMPWLALRYDGEMIDSVKARYQHQSIPHMVVLNPSGQLVSSAGRSEIFSKQVLSLWANKSSYTSSTRAVTVPNTLAHLPDPLSSASRYRVWAALDRKGLFTMNDTLQSDSGVLTLDASNVSFCSKGGVYLNGLYGTSDAYVLRTPDILSDLSALTVTLDVCLESLERPQWLFVGGSMLRWLAVRIECDGSIVLTFNNQNSHLLLHGLVFRALVWTAFVIGLDTQLCVVRVTMAEGADPPVRREFPLPPGFRFRAIDNVLPGRSLLADGHITFTNLSNGGTLNGLVRHLGVFSRILTGQEMDAVCGRDVRLASAAATETGVDLSRISLASDAPSVLQAISRGLGYSDQKIDALVELFTANDYLCLRHLAEDTEWCQFYQDIVFLRPADKSLLAHECLPNPVNAE